MSDPHDQVPDDLVEVSERLTAARPKLSAERLGLTRELALSRARAGRRRAQPGTHAWRPRLLLTGLLVLGIMLSTTGVGLAISGLGGSGSAGKAQYRSPGRVLGDSQSGGGQTVAKEDASATDVAGQTQATTGESSLPFTGLAAIPLILVGGTLLITGVGLRRRV